MIKNFEKILQENPVLSREIHKIRETMEKERIAKKWSFQKEADIWNKRNSIFLKKYGYKIVPWQTKGEGIMRLEKI